MRIAKSFTWLGACAAPVAALAVALIYPTFQALGATVTYTNPNCASFTTSGTGASLTVTCSGTSSGGGGTVPTCAPTASPGITVSVGTSPKITANCDNQPTSYTWASGTGSGISGCSSGANTCTVSKPNRRNSATYMVSGTNGAGTGTAASITITWQ